MARDCMTETRRQAYPSQRRIETRPRRSELDSADERRINRNRRNQEHANVVTIQELASSGEDSDDEEYEEYHAYPVTENARRPGRPKKTSTPYQQTQGRAHKGSPLPTGNRDEGFDEEIRQVVERDQDDDIMGDDEEPVLPKHRKSKTYSFDVWKVLKKTTVPITWEELTQL